MGKRKLHDRVYYTCDWTGYPMAECNAYMPLMKNGKLTKKGSYCNFESVVAHAQELLKEGRMTAEEVYQVNQHVLDVTGGVALPHPEELHYSNLDHFGGKLTIDAYAAKCSSLHPITGVKVSPNGDVFEVILTPELDKTPAARAKVPWHTGVQSWHYPIEKYLSTPYMLPRDGGEEEVPSFFRDVQKRPKLKQCDAVFCYHTHPNGLPRNATASKILKREVHGDLLILCKTREPSLFHAPRYVHFTKQTYEQVFEKKKRATAAIKPTPGIGTDEWQKLQGEMQSSVAQFEASVSHCAEQPGKLAKGAVMPPATGKELVVAAEMHGFYRECRGQPLTYRPTDEPSRR